jgi:hypothetical protein
MNSLAFPLWLEARDDRPIVFSDMDETLVHNMEIGWLKDDPKNKKFAKLVVPGKHPYPDVKEIHAEGHDMYVFPRPGATQFIKAINRFADFVILSHSDIDYVRKVVDVLGWKKLVKDCYSTGDTKPGELAKKYNLANRKWLLVDNLHIHSIEICNKLRILGLGIDTHDPKDIVKHIIGQAERHFIDVADWVPTVDEYDDFELWNTLPKIKQKFDLDWSEPDPNF